MSRLFNLSAASLLLFSTALYASDECAVIGYHPSGTQQYMGPTICEGKQIHNIEVYGPLSASTSTLSGLSKISGPVSANATTFDSLEVENTLTPQKVQLTNCSTVKQDITFLGMGGTVYIDKSSKINGKVNNGTIVHQ